MTQMIDREHRAGGSQPDTSDDPATNRRPGVVTAARIVFGAMMTCSLGCLCVTFALDNWRWALAAATFATFSLLAGVVIAIDMLLTARMSTCRQYYFAGQLDGWMRGWNGQPPEIQEPPLK